MDRLRVNLDVRPYGDILWNSLCVQGKPDADQKWFDAEVMKMEVYKWCVDNLSGNFDFDIDCPAAQLFLNHFYFEFELEEDAVAFKLRWL